MNSRDMQLRVWCAFRDFVERHAFALALLAIAMYVVYFSWYTILNHFTYQTFAYDLGIYMQSLWSTINGYGFFYLALWDTTRFAYHFEPVLLAILPLYAALPRAETLLVLQSVVLGSGAIPVFLFARQRLGSTVGLGFAGLYLMYPGLHGINGFDFHATALAVPLLLAAHYCLSAGRLRAGMAFALVALTCRENVSLVVFTMGLYWAWQWRRRGVFSLDRVALPADRRLLFALGLCLAALTWFVFSVNVAIPFFAGSDVHPAFERYEGALWSAMDDPRGKLLYLVQLFGPLGFLSLLSPGSLLIGAPVFAENLLSGEPGMYNVTNHYAALLVPWLFFSAVDGMTVVSSATRAQVTCLQHRILVVLFAVTTVFALLYSRSPIGLGRTFPVVDAHHRVVSQAIELLPDNAFVFAQNDLFPHVCHSGRAHSVWFRHGVDIFQYNLLFGREVVPREEGQFDYILLDTASPQNALAFVPQETIDTLEREYGVLAVGDGVLLYKRGYLGEVIELTG